MGKFLAPAAGYSPVCSGTALVGSTTDFGKHIADETEKWGKVHPAAKINAD
jgi:hypothetical protein